MEGQVQMRAEGLAEKMLGVNLYVKAEVDGSLGNVVRETESVWADKYPGGYWAG